MRLYIFLLGLGLAVGDDMTVTASAAPSFSLYSASAAPSFSLYSASAAPSFSLYSPVSYPTYPVVSYPTNPVVSYPTYQPVWPSSCSFSSCTLCTAQYGCVWSGSYCYYSNTPCYGSGCANTPSQCGYNPGPGTTCNYYNCGQCTAAPGCVWSGSYCYYSYTPCSGYGCANTPSQCGGVITPPPVANCGYYSNCLSCAAAQGCVWSGSYCYYSTTPCYGYGCANTPSQCGGVTPPISSCSYSNCQSCTAAPGCVWSGSYCYYSYTPCSGFGCANTPADCTGCYSDAQCGPGFRCSLGSCVPGGIVGGSCNSYSNCFSCLSNPGCLWDPNVLLGNCKPLDQCDFTYKALAMPMVAASAPPPATACVRSVNQCYQTNFNGAPLTPNPYRGLGCTNHGQCQPGEYCFACSRCRGDCSPCYQGGIPVSGACGPAWRCPIDGDSIDYTCPTY